MEHKPVHHEAHRVTSHMEHKPVHHEAHRVTSHMEHKPVHHEAHKDLSHVDHNAIHPTMMHHDYLLMHKPTEKKECENEQKNITLMINLFNEIVNSNDKKLISEGIKNFKNMNYGTCEKAKELGKKIVEYLMKHEVTKKEKVKEHFLFDYSDDHMKKIKSTFFHDLNMSENFDEILKKLSDYPNEKVRNIINEIQKNVNLNKYDSSEETLKNLELFLRMFYNLLGSDKLDKLEGVETLFSKIPSEKLKSMFVNKDKVLEVLNDKIKYIELLHKYHNITNKMIIHEKLVDKNDELFKMIEFIRNKSDNKMELNKLFDHVNKMSSTDFQKYITNKTNLTHDNVVDLINLKLAKKYDYQFKMLFQKVKTLLDIKYASKDLEELHDMIVNDKDDKLKSLLKEIKSMETDELKDAYLKDVNLHKDEMEYMLKYKMDHLR
jgi:hypothetical protein